MPQAGRSDIFAVTGVTGQVGGAVARTLLQFGKRVRAVVRDAQRANVWRDEGCEIAVADMNDARALRSAFAGIEGVFVLLPPIFAPSKGFPEIAAIISALKEAIDGAKPKKVVCLSTIGAQAVQENLLTQLQMMEKSLGTLPMSVGFLRAGWFLENASWDVESACKGQIRSFLQPLDKKFPMVATADVGRVVAELLQENWTGKKIVELEGPARVSPNEIAATFSKVLGKPVKVSLLPREEWEAFFKQAGMQDPQPRIRMLEGFNEGWICFEWEDKTIKGKIPLETVLRGLVAIGNT